MIMLVSIPHVKYVTYQREKIVSHKSCDGFHQ
jgi:hypothetical protein